jgi:signal transduction histidine kinase
VSTDQTNQRFIFELGEGEALADPMRTRQIARNLISNAVRYGGSEVRVTVSTEGNAVLLTVSDNGPGVPEDEKESIFQAFSRASGFEGRPGSIGLGLTVSRYLADAMQGSLTYRRLDGISRFRLALPRYRGEADGEVGATEPR